MSDDMPVAMKIESTTIVITDYGHGYFEACVRGERTYGSGSTRAQAVRSLALLRPGVFCVPDAINQASNDEQFGEKVLADPAKYNIIIDERIDPTIQE